jgi:acyl carrier protein
MGMELIAIVMDIEDEFGFQLPDADAERIHTIGQTVAYVIGRLREQAPIRSDHCPTSRAFYRLREQLRARFGVKRRVVTPASRIGELVRSRVQRFGWNDAAMASGLRPEHIGVFSNPFTPAFPPPQMTVRDLIYTRMGTSAKHQAFYLDNGEVNTHIVWRRVQRIVSERLGVGVDELKWDTRFIEDLNAS